MAMRLNQFRELSAFVVFTAIWGGLATSCGSSDFSGLGGGGSKGSSSGTGKTAPVAPAILPSVALTSLNWYWQCANDPGTAPVQGVSDAVIKDGGNHSFSTTNFAKDVPVTISGRLCPPSKYPRDIVFVIDVSGSMQQNDKEKSRSCGRLAAVKNIIANAVTQGKDARFGLVTFSDNVKAQSSAMFADDANLFADIGGAANPAAILCDTNGNTAYGAGLSAAEKILKSSRAGAIKEIYFISDGEPTDLDASMVSLGVPIASRLRLPGVSISGTMTPVKIATVKLGKEDGAVLKNNIASRDKNGNPFYALATDASLLADTLNKLAANDIDTGTVKYRPIGDPNWTEIVIKDLVKDYNFTIPAFNTSVASAPNGLEVSFEYSDLHNNIYSNQGTIQWQSTP